MSGFGTLYPQEVVIEKTRRCTADLAPSMQSSLRFMRVMRGIKLGSFFSTTDSSAKSCRMREAGPNEQREGQPAILADMRDSLAAGFVFSFSCDFQ